MTYFQQNASKSHTHRYFVDSANPTAAPVCLCGKEEGNEKRIGPGTNKYKAKKSNYRGYVYDSQKEASHAAELDLLLKAGEIVSWERQYPVRVEPEGIHFFTTKVDFRVLLPDGSYELHEVKSWMTERLGDYRLRRKALELYWLPKHPDHIYKVIN